MVSNTYIPGTEMSIKMSFIDDDIRNRRICEEASFEEEESNIVTYGISDAWIKNIRYKNLINSVGIDRLEIDGMINEVSKHIFGEKISLNSSQAKNTRSEPSLAAIDHDIKKLIILKWKNGWPMKTISSALGLCQQIWRIVINEWKRDDNLQI